MSVVIDASALLCVLLAEDGSDVVIPVLRGSTMSAVNIAECCSRAVERELTVAGILRAISRFEIDVVALDLAQAVRAGELREPTRHVGASLGDRACLALAAMRDMPIYTGDRKMASLRDDLDIEIRLIR